MHEELRPLIAGLDERLLEAYRTDTKLFDRLSADQVRLGILAGERPFAPFLRPEFFTRRRYNRIVEAAEVLYQAFETMTAAALEDDEVMAELALTEREERYARMDPGYAGVCNTSRLDSFIAGDEFSFLEYNGETPAGIVDQIQIETVMRSIPEVADFLNEHPHWLPRPHERLLEALVANYRDFGGTKEKPNIAIVDWKGVETFSEFIVLQEFFESKGHRTVVVDPGELDYDGKTLRAGDLDVDIFYKRVLIHELFERSDDDHPILRAYADGNLFMANSFRTKIPHKKASLAVLHTERFDRLFTDRQREMIERHIPWTRRVADRKTRYAGEFVDMLEFVRATRERLILKPNDDYGGSGIVVGWESDESDWDDAIENALKVPFVVQERVPVEKVEFPMYEGGEARLVELLIDFDPFLFRGKVEGGLVRLSAQSLVNVAAGGGETSLVVLEDFA